MIWLLFLHISLRSRFHFPFEVLFSFSPTYLCDGLSEPERFNLSSVPPATPTSSEWRRVLHGIPSALCHVSIPVDLGRLCDIRCASERFDRGGFEGKPSDSCFCCPTLLLDNMALGTGSGNGGGNGGAVMADAGSVLFLGSTSFSGNSALLGATMYFTQPQFFSPTSCVVSFPSLPCLDCQMVLDSMLITIPLFVKSCPLLSGVFLVGFPFSRVPCPPQMCQYTRTVEASVS